jgi:hypothetical protein
MPGQCADGSVAARYEYGRWELIQAQADGQDQSVSFLHEVLRLETDSILWLSDYDRAREVAGRDPIEERAEELVGFIGNDPINRIDPLGLWWWDGGYIEWGVGGLLGLKGGPGTAGEAWSGFGEGWSKGGQGVINDFTGGLFDSQYGLFYDSFDKLDKEAFGSGIKCDSAFKFGSNAGRVAEGSLLAAGAVYGAFYAPGASIFYSGSAAEAEALSMAAAGEGSTILNTLGGRFWCGPAHEANSYGETPRRFTPALAVRKLLY